METDANLLAPCGLYCGVCGVYYATRDKNEKFMQLLVSFYQDKIPNLGNISTEDLHCEGCLSNKLSVFCKTCSIRDCVQTKGFAGCHECDDFPCELIDNFPLPIGRKVCLRAVPFRREFGTEMWVADEEARYVCPECDNKIFRGAKRCNKCKIELDLD